MDAADPRPARGATFVLAAILVNVCLSCWFVDWWDTNPSTNSRVLSVVSWNRHGTWSIDRYHGRTIDKALVRGRYYSDKPPLPSWLVVPVHHVATQAGWLGTGVVNTVNTFALGGVVVGSLPFAAIVVLTLLYLPRRTGWASVALTMVGLYGSFVFVYSGTFFSHVLAAALLLGAYIALRFHERLMLAGFLTGLAVLCEYPLAVFAIGWLALVAVRGSWRGALRFACGGTPAAMVLLVYNHTLTGSPFTTLQAYLSEPQFAQATQAYGLGLPTAEAVWGLTLSLRRGLLWYLPVLAPALVAAWRARLGWRRLLGSYLVLPSLAAGLAISGFYMWWGGFCYGPRHLIPAGVLVAFEGLRLLSRESLRPRWTWWVLGAGAVATWAARTTVLYKVDAGETNPVLTVVLRAYASGQFNANNVLTHFAGVAPWAASHAWLLALGLAVALLGWLDQDRPAAD